ncbi:MAG: queuosine salvage family protein [Candidatus Woesearchaeota archaeon]
MTPSLELENINFVINNATQVKISADKIKRFADSIQIDSLHHWLEIYPQLNPKDVLLGRMFVQDAISFCYWGDPKWGVSHNNQRSEGALALIVSLGRAIEEGYPIYDPTYLKELSRPELEQILRGNVEIPLLDQRLEILRSLGEITCNGFGSDFVNLIKVSNYDTSNLVNILVKEFPFFRDESFYKGRLIKFNKRAQLLASDVHNCYHSLSGMEELSACADYRLPQVFYRQGIFEYSPLLEQKILSPTEITAGSEEEVEIRASTIYVINKITEFVREHFPSVTSMQVNDYVWLYRRENYPNDEIHHRTITTAY